MNKKLLILLSGYTIWIVATLLYNKKNPSEIQSEMDKAKKSWDDNLKVFFNNFLEIHQNLLDSLKAKVLTKENKLIFKKKKEELLQLADEYKQKAEDLFEEYKEKWKDYAEEWVEKLEKFYKETLVNLDGLKEEAPEKYEQTKKKINHYLDDLKSKVKKS